MKLDYKKTFFIGLGFMSICAFWQLYDNLIPLILENTFGFGEKITGVIMAMDNILALFLLPLFGAFSDKTNTRFGKRIPYIIIGTIIAVLSMNVLPLADRAENLPLFVITLGIVLVAMGSYRSPAVALMPDLTQKAHRSRANAVVNLMGAAGGVFTLVAIKFLVDEVEKPNYYPLFLAIMIFMVVAVGILFITIKEKKLSAAMVPENEEVVAESGEKVDKLPKEVQKSLYFILISIFLWFMAYNAVTTAFSRYAKNVWGMKGGGFADALLVATIAAIVSYIPIGFLSSKFGRKKMILSGIVLMAVAYFAGSRFQEYHVVINLFFGLIGIGWASISVNSYPMVVEMSKGSDVGKYTGLYYAASMAAQVVTPVLSGIFLENVSYLILFPYAVVFSILSFCTMLMVKHGNVKPERKVNPLENFDLDD